MISQLNPSLIPPSSHHFRRPFSASAANGNRGGAPPQIPPISPYSQIPATLQPRHSRSMSQPSSFFSFDSMPPTSPMSVEDRNLAAGFTPSPSPFNMCSNSSSSSSSSRFLSGDVDNLPPRKSHRRSNSDVTFGFSSIMSHSQKSPPLERSISGGDVKEEPREGFFFRGSKSDSESANTNTNTTMDDVFTAYMNLDNIHLLNSFGGSEEDAKNNNENNNVDEMESSRGSITKKPNGVGGGSSSDSDEGESSASGNALKVAAVTVSTSSSSGVKRRAGGDIAPPPTARHYRSLSMDSCFMGKLKFGDESSSQLKLQASSPKVSPSNSGEANSSAYCVEFGNSEFSAAEMKKIAADEKLAEIVMADPKRVKRILANRVSAARSKERKTRYMAELEHKVQTLQTEATTLSAQLTHLQRDSMGLMNQNTELKFRLQAMEQQAQLRDALSEKLNEEVQRLKLVIGEPGRRQVSSSSESKTTINTEMFEQLSISQLQQQQQHQQQQQQQQQMHHTNQNSAVKSKAHIKSNE
ncbi:unnamed protein product [Cochlearia groenlandica]